MATVPHSGTRYIIDAIGRAGVKINTTYNGGGGFMYGHFQQPAIKRLYAASKDARRFVLLRDPALIWASHNKDMPVGKDPADTLKNLTGYFNSQLDYIAKFNPATYCVDRDPLSELGDWMGLELYGNPNHNSVRSYGLKKAVIEEDEDSIREIAPAFWEQFKENCTPLLTPYAQAGYDLWWDNG